MWPELEEHFSLARSANQPHVLDGRFRFVTYSEYMPVLKLSRITVDLRTLAVSEQPLVNAPWPPVPVPAAAV